MGRVSVYRASPGPVGPQRLQTLRSAGPTRLGAALRHVAARLLAQHASVRWLLLLPDGQPHGVGAHDRRALVGDARHAVRQGRRAAVQPCSRAAVRRACIRLAPALAGLGTAQSADDSVVNRIFGPAGVQAGASLDALPRLVLRLLGRLFG